MDNFKLFNLIGKINREIEKEFSRFACEAIKTPNIPVVIAIDSAGGSIDVGFEIYKKLRTLPNPIYTLITGSCGNIANIISLATPFENRFALGHSIFCVNRNFSTITDSDATNQNKNVIEKKEFKICEIISSQTNISDDTLIDIFMNHDITELRFTHEHFEINKIATIISRYDDIFAFKKAV